MGISPPSYHTSGTHTLPYLGQSRLLTATEEIHAISQLAANIPFQSLE